MPTQPTTAWEAFRKNPAAMCCNCGDSAAEAPEEQVWYIWNGKHLYCPECARQHGIT